MPAPSTTKDTTPDSLALVCEAGLITIDAASKDADDRLPRVRMVAYTGDAMRIDF